MRKKINIFFLSLCILLAGRANAQLTITTNQTADQLASLLVGSGVTYSNATLLCGGGANGKFTNVGTTLVGIDSGILLTSGDAAIVAGPELGIQTGQTGTGADPDLNILSGVQTFDKCILEFDFVPQGDSIKFDYIFGSDENPGFWCSTVNDVFGFFISGPGFGVPTNIALVPGTTIPVTINSVNGETNPNNLCTDMGPGSPFTQYYTSNAGSTTVCYGGFTHLFQALAEVQPCETYHLKLAIADGGDPVYDSGVFLKTGSLSSNSVTVEPIGGGGLIAPEPYCVRGCLPGQFVFTLNDTPAFDYVVKFDIGGTAIPGYDYTPIADSIVIQAGQITATATVNGLVVPPVGPKTVLLYIKSPFNCNNIVYTDTVKMNIYDSLFADILTPDTTVCRFQSVDVVSIADTILTIAWSPASDIDSPSVLTPTITPTQTTTYTMIASLPGSGCAPVHNTITISIADEPDLDLGADVDICLGNSYQFPTSVTPSNQTYAFTWSPGTYLDNPAIADPTMTPTGDITYYVMATPTSASCPGYDTVNVHVIPNDFTLSTPDTAFCDGQSILVNANGPIEFSYHWTPSTGVSDPFVINPLITPQESGTFTITASHPNCPDIVKSFDVDLQPIPQAFLGPDREMCQWHPIDIEAEVLPTWYTLYSYDWSTEDGLVDSLNPYHVRYTAETDGQVIVDIRTPAGCTGSDTVNVVVHPGNFASVTPTEKAVCPGEEIPLAITGGTIFQWSPEHFLSDPTSATPIASPVTDMFYEILVTDQFGCKDSLNVDITVHPASITHLPDSVRLWPGETYQIDPGGNSLYYQWFPTAGLSDPNISNPVASPTTDTRYYVTARSEWGCEVKDSIDILISTESILDVPNAFIPGTDVNKEFKIVKKGIATLEYFRIFNRWGQLVFETKDIEKGWDGTFKGTPQPFGVYVYMIEAFTSTHERFYKQGNVTLIR